MGFSWENCGRVNITASIHRELIEKIRIAKTDEKVSKKNLSGVLDHVDLSSTMPGQRSADKETLSFYVPRTLGRRLRKMAELLGATITDVVVMILSKETNSVELTPEDYEQIARDTRAAQRKNTARSKAAAPQSREK